mmetsp:Transcript_21904/g.34320  ORF Transcript_21904/g.34320 Transcript_21904/m.34320 type:complete len:88 (-) Transcript_21904:163-426(-)|eukprot:CAMPEP_0184311064 /NCGR_PEP_ID=MMETSP1049-20130417/38063_1 /TAXON_ID=77928 /ORGANISM="Proteomonas sulcata, Strain CCMP704" /LENGTH=87 /DNA_ID=CAMNT_0026626071 /DNA_START=42 /DNA_END=305 /DNA_ORIENTATION=+
MVFSFLKASKESAQDEAMQAAKDVSSILAAKKAKKPAVNANEMAALALTFHPGLALSASKNMASGNVARTDKLVSAAVPGKKFKPTW